MGILQSGAGSRQQLLRCSGTSAGFCVTAVINGRRVIHEKNNLLEAYCIFDKINKTYHTAEYS